MSPPPLQVRRADYFGFVAIVNERCYLAPTLRYAHEVQGMMRATERQRRSGNTGQRDRGTPAATT
jgi:hypothetical protein